MSQYLFFNGKILQENNPLIQADNRCFRYGDGLFETMKVIQGKIQLGDYHFERLFYGMALLQFELPSHFTAEYLSTRIAALLLKNNQTFARVRLAVFRGNGGLYDAQDNLPNYIIQSWDLPCSDEPLNENGLVVGIYPDAKKAGDRFSNLKSSNYLPYVMAALDAKKRQWNDALVLNTGGRICDSSMANVFIIKNNTLLTPSLTEGGVAGVMRRFILKTLPGLGFRVEEAELTVDEIANADELFLSNAIYGIRWVSQCENTTYGHQQITAIHKALFQKPVPLP